MKTTAHLIEIAKAGGGIKISAKDKTVAHLVEIASSLTENSKLIITDSDDKTTAHLVEIAKAGKGKVIFEF